MRSSSGTPTPCTCARCCPTCTLRTPPALPSTPPCGTLSEATGRQPARTHHPALASGTRARGHRYPRARPRPRPPSSAPCQPQVPRPSGGPRQARQHPCTCAPRSLACTARSPPARPPTPQCGALGASADRSQRPPRPPHPLGRTPLPMRPAPASAPRPRNQVTAGPSARGGARTGHTRALAHVPSAAWLVGRALPRRAHRPYCVGRSGPVPTAGWTARTPRDRHGPRTRMAPRPTRPPAATHAPGQGRGPPPAVPRGLPYAGHRDGHQGTAPEPNTARQQL